MLGNMINIGDGHLGSGSPRALFGMLFPCTGTQSGNYFKVDKREDHQSSHQSNRYHQYVVETSQVPPAVALTFG